VGRTNPTYRDLLGSVEERWATYRRGLRRDDKPHFDRLFEHARRHADASGLQNHDDPLAAVLFSVALEQETAIAALEDRVAALEDTVEEDPSERP
jgi:predicted secreted Zn-dependent protease